MTCYGSVPAGKILVCNAADCAQAASFTEITPAAAAGATLYSISCSDRDHCAAVGDVAGGTAVIVHTTTASTDSISRSSER